MWFKSSVFLASLLCFARAQSISDPAVQQMVAALQAAVPTCAFNCILTAVPQSVCEITDNNCVCTNPELNAGIQACLGTNCTVKEQLRTAKFQTLNCGLPVQNESAELRVTNWVLFSIATFFVLCRLLARLPFLGGELSWDDYLIIIAALGNTATAVVLEKLTQFGLGQDMWMLEPDNITNVLKFFFIAEVLYAFVVLTTKLSIILLYLRIFPVRSFQIQCYILIALSVGHGLAGWIAQPFICRPTNFFWEQWTREWEGHCPIDVNAQLYAMSSTNIALDLAIWLVPIPQLIKLNMNWKKKAGMSLIFLVGLFETACSVLRMWTITFWGHSTNPTLDYESLGLWSIIELDVGIICACMPGVATLLRRMMPNIFASTKGSKESKGSSGGYSNPPHSLKKNGQDATWGGLAKDRFRRIHKTTDVSVSYGNNGAPPRHFRDDDDDYEMVSRKESQTPLRPPQLEMPSLEPRY